jgi:putative membrane protein
MSRAAVHDGPATPAAGVPMRSKPSRYELGLLASMVILLAWSGIHPHDRFTWWLETAPIFVGIPVLIWLYPRLRLTPLTYGLIWVHCLILMAGGHYTYARVPLGFWMEDWFGFARNHYDRIGHLAQGFIPAMVAREILIRRSPLRGSRWLPFFVVCFCLAFSALYELIEFWTAITAGGAATDFLGTQGDPWDTQWDMQMALIGAVASVVLLSRVQDRQLAAMRAG